MSLHYAIIIKILKKIPRTTAMPICDSNILRQYPVQKRSHNHSHTFIFIFFCYRFVTAQYLKLSCAHTVRLNLNCDRAAWPTFAKFFGGFLFSLYASNTYRISYSCGYVYTQAILWNNIKKFPLPYKTQNIYLLNARCRYI